MQPGISWRAHTAVPAMVPAAFLSIVQNFERELPQHGDNFWTLTWLEQKPQLSATFLTDTVLVLTDSKVQEISKSDTANLLAPDLNLEIADEDWL